MLIKLLCFQRRQVIFFLVFHHFKLVFLHLILLRRHLLGDALGNGLPEVVLVLETPHPGMVEHLDQGDALVGLALEQLVH